VEEFRYLGTTLSYQNSFQGEIKSRMKSGNASFHLLQNILSFSLLSKHLKFKIYRTIILPVILYGCETWLLTLREECRLRVFESRVLRRIFGLERDEVTGVWRKLLKEELNIICLLKQRRMRWVGHVVCMGGGGKHTEFWWGKPEGKRLLGRPRHRWEDKMDL